MAIGGFDDALVIIRVDAPASLADARLIANHLRWLDRAGWQAAVDARFRAAPPVPTDAALTKVRSRTSGAREALTPLYVRSRD
jgi:hypothetical protein